MFSRLLKIGMLCMALIPTLVTTPVLAQDGSDMSAQATGTPIEFDINNDLILPMLLATAYTILGVILFAICIWLVVKVCPFSVRKEIEEDQNTSLGIIIGAMILGVAIILAAAIAS